MAKRKKKTLRDGYTIRNFDEIGECISDFYSYRLDAFERAFTEGKGKEFMLETFKAGAKPIIFDIERFMAQHERTGSTWSAFNEGVLLDRGNDILYFKFGFDIKQGGLPALFLEYGDNGSPMRMPNKAHYFMYYAVENNIHQFRGLADAKVSEMLEEVFGS